MDLTKIFVLVSWLFLNLYCQHKPLQKPAPQFQFIVDQDFRALVTHSQSFELWSSKARQEALGGIYIPQTQVPSSEVLFGMPFDRAKKMVRILDFRSTEEFNRLNLSMDPKIKVPVVHFPAEKFFTATGEVDPAAKTQLEEKNVTRDSIVIVLCNKQVPAQTIANGLRSLGYQRVLIFEGQYQPWQQCEAV